MNEVTFTGRVFPLRRNNALAGKINDIVAMTGHALRDDDVRCVDPKASP